MKEIKLNEKKVSTGNENKINYGVRKTKLSMIGIEPNEEVQVVEKISREINENNLLVEKIIIEISKVVKTVSYKKTTRTKKTISEKKAAE